jgi:hypothetical protein
MVLLSNVGGYEGWFNTCLFQLFMFSSQISFLKPPRSVRNCARGLYACMLRQFGRKLISLFFINIPVGGSLFPSRHR